MHAVDEHCRIPYHQHAVGGQLGHPMEAALGDEVSQVLPSLPALQEGRHHWVALHTLQHIVGLDAPLGEL